MLAPGGAIVIPKGGTETDFEAELGVVVGKRARASAADAMDTARYCNFDVSARDFQFADGQWQRGKACDTFAPFGEFVATTDEIPDRTSSVSDCASTARRCRTRTPTNWSSGSRADRGPVDLVCAGARRRHRDRRPRRRPPASRPSTKAGDVCEVEIDGLGVLRNPVAAFEA